MKVLLTDDSRTIRILLHNLLDQLGITDVHECQNGREALEQLVKQHFDLILLDIHMPEADGLTVLEFIKQNPESTHKEIPVVVISSDTDYRQIEKARDLGAYGYIKKPFRRDGLAAAIEAAAKIHERSQRANRVQSLVSEMTTGEESAQTIIAAQ